MTRPVFIVPIGYSRACRLAVIGPERHATACLASIPADEPVAITTRRPIELCAACRADLAVREARGDDLTPYAGEIGVRADVEIIEPTVRAAEELFGAAAGGTPTTAMPKLSAAVEAWDSWWAEARGDDEDSFDDLRREEP